MQIQLFYLTGRDISNKETLYNRVDQFMKEHMPKLDHDDKKELFANMQLLRKCISLWNGLLLILFSLDWQTKRKQCADSVIGQLAAWCTREWETNKNSIAPLLDFKQRFKVDDFTFEWTAMNVLASMQLWPQLAAFFIKPVSRDNLKLLLELLTL